jgi:multidrug efflux pump subunit AcrB
MWIVKLALSRPYTFVVASILIVILGALAIVRTPTDIFPNINIPVVSIIWNYNGMVPEDISDRIVSVTERALTTTVDNIEHVESQSLYGIAVVKVFLQPTFSKGLRRLRRFHRLSSGNYLRDQRHHSFLPTAHQVCRFCS